MGDWKYDVDEVGEDAADPTPALEPGSPSVENALFVILGVVTTLLVLASILGVV